MTCDWPFDADPANLSGARGGIGACRLPAARGSAGEHSEAGARRGRIGLPGCRPGPRLSCKCPGERRMGFGGYIWGSPWRHMLLMGGVLYERGCTRASC